MAIEFYRVDKPFGFLSNLYKRAIVYDGRDFPTSEHAYQYSKPRDPKVADWLMQAKSPALLAATAHVLSYWEVRSDWAQIKIDRMRGVVTAKFSQHVDLREQLLMTGEETLIEVGTTDNAVNRYWGCVRKDGRLVGQNTLGDILMEVRSLLRHSEERAGVLEGYRPGQSSCEPDTQAPCTAGRGRGEGTLHWRPLHESIRRSLRFVRHARLRSPVHDVPTADR